MKSLGLKVTLLLLFALLAGWVRLAHLGWVNLHDDEYYQFETAVGWLKLHEWVRYDYYTEGAGKPYDRAKLFIVQVAASIKLFGETEFAGRLPAALWGSLLIPIVVLCLLKVVRHQWIAYGTGFVLIFDQLSIGLSRYVRMYSMLMVLVVLFVTFIYLLLETPGWKKRLLYGVAATFTTLLSLSIFKELTLAIIGAFGVYATLRATGFIATRHSRDWPWFIIWCLGAIGAALAIGLTLAGYNIIPLDAVIVRTNPHWSYFIELFTSWRVPAIAAGLTLLGMVIALRQLRSYLGLATVISLVILIYFTFFSHRWDAQRYISIVVPFISLIAIVGLVATIRFLYGLLPKPVWLRWILLVPLVFLIGPVITFAHADEDYADMKTAYAYVAEHVEPGEVVLMQGPRFYYWPDNTIPVYLLGGYKSLTIEEFKALAQNGTKGGWVIFNVTHQRHLRDNIKEYMATNFEYIKTLEDTNVIVYHYVPGDLAQRKK